MAKRTPAEPRRAGGFALWRGLLVLVLCAAVAAGWLWRDWSRFTTTPLAVPTAGLTLDIARGSGFAHIIDELRQRRLTRAPQLYWRALAEQMRVTAGLHAGEYAVRPGMTPRQLLVMLARGDVIQHRFTLVDGWTFREVRTALDAAPDLAHASRGLDDAALMARLGHANVAPEGRFLPETYAFVKGDSDLDVLARAWRAMDELLAKAWPQRAEGLPLETPTDALILASIVEKETARGDERARIAGVFERRLRIGMPLATDPTIIYGMGDAYQGNIRKRDLQTDTPFNTYLHAGLPPTPIAMPGKPAIEAVLHPAPGKDLYFVARGDGSGSHVFSETLAEHNRAVACYQLKRCR